MACQVAVDTVCIHACDVTVAYVCVCVHVCACVFICVSVCGMWVYFCICVSVYMCVCVVGGLCLSVCVCDLCTAAEDEGMLRGTTCLHRGLQRLYLMPK